MRRRRFVSRANGPGAILVALAVALAVVLRANVAGATDPDRVEWSPDWPRGRLVEGLDILAFTVASYEIDAQWPPPHTASVHGGILFDGAVRTALRGRSPSAETTAGDLSDYLYKGGVIAPYIIDVYVVALGVHQNADVAVQMLLMDMQSLGIAGVISIA